MRKLGKEFQELLGSDRGGLVHFETHFYENMATHQMHVPTRMCQANSFRVPLIRHPCYVLSTQIDSHGSVILICIREVDVSSLRRESGLS
jgi:hypothetical protein